ncbi:MAG: imidazole glycerol phosphate synthase subunit HisF [Bacteroidetes bacterium]|nr:imidazole glycerol phosphate synthase subunit HisF [Bacteroidota bacterium]
MLSKRIIPCLDIKDGRTVKGVNFVGLRDAGDPVELAKLYAEQGADELVLLDITATHEKRKTVVELATKVAEQLNIPFTIGGGISSVEDAHAVLNAGADKISINSAAVKNPQLINDLAEKFGSQCVVVAVDAKQIFNDPTIQHSTFNTQNSKWFVHLNGGRIKTDLELFAWVQEAEQRGAGEILFTSMDHDGTKAGFADEALAKMNSVLNIPIIASGGAGNMEHIRNTFINGKSDAALAASIFHFKEISIPDLKKYLKEEGVLVR